MPVVIASEPHDAAVTLAAGRGPVVAVPVYNAYDDVVQCLGAVIAHTPPDVAVLVLDDGSTDPRIRELPARLGELPHVVIVLRRAENRGFVHTANEAFAVAGRRDVVLLNSDVVVGPEWLERLRAAAYSDSRVATATPLTNYGTILSVPHRNRPSELPRGYTPASAATAVAAASLRLYPRLPACVGHCTYVRRMALDVVGCFDEAFAPGYGEEVDFSQRCVQAGLAHVCADDVFVYHRGSGSFGRSDAARALCDEHERWIAERYPYYHAWVAATADLDVAPLGGAIATARRALRGLTVAFDATALGSSLVGTQRVAVEVARALARHSGIAELLVVTRPGSPPSSLQRAVDGVEKVRIITDDPALRLGADVAYRPVQVWASEDVDRLHRMAHRCVIQQLDLITYGNPTYFPSWHAWAYYRDLVHYSLAVADGVAFSTMHAADDARAEGLITPGTPIKVTLNGLDHGENAVALEAPAGAPVDLVAAGFVLCFGTDCRHKNRLFALRVFAAMCASGYAGRLVMAGPRTEHGSSRGQEADFLLRHREVAGRVLIVAEVSEGERLWLYRHAGLVLFPTLYEGFGLVPFEAAVAGTPCLSSRVASLDEVLPGGIEVIDDWDPDRIAEQALGLLGDPERRGRLVDAVAARAREFTWARTAGNLVELFEEVCRRGARPVVQAVQGDGGVMPRRAAASPGPLAMLDGMYPPEVHEALRAIGQRPMLRRPLSRLAVLLYRIASRMREALAHGRTLPVDGGGSVP